jgi:hypothetical protein
MTTPHGSCLKLTQMGSALAVKKPFLLKIAGGVWASANSSSKTLTMIETLVLSQLFQDCGIFDLLVLCQQQNF